MCGFTSVLSLWAMINQLQLYMLLFVTGAFIPSDILEFIAGNELMIFTLDYSPMNKFYLREQLSKLIGYDQDMEIFGEVGITSGSSIVNLFYIILLVLALGVFHLILKLLPRVEEIADPTERQDPYDKFMSKIWRIFTFGIYLRITVIAYQFILLCCTSEIYRLDLSSTERIISF